jgi:SAM-dependent methyltransferase
VIPYQTPPREIFSHNGLSIASFDIVGPNLDAEIVGSFGSEWKKFGWFSDDAIETAAGEYFDIVPQEVLTTVGHALDVGCGSGRWSRYLSSRVGFVESLDPSEAVLSASELNRDRLNVRVTRASIDAIPFADASFDLAICLGVIHHLPDPALALRKVVSKVKEGGYILIYVYYDLDQRGPFYRGLFRVADLVRRVVSSLPGRLKGWVCDAIAFTVYLPLVGIARLASWVLGAAAATEQMPLSYYTNKTLLEIRTDALDRFGTAVERRFTRDEFVTMMTNAGLAEIVVSPRAPFWHGVGRRRAP